MTLFFVILIILACVFLGLIILVQNPKGGGLAGNVGGFSNQLMGVKQTTDVLEKGTWVLAIVVGLLCLFAAFFIPRVSGGGQKGFNEKISAPSSQTAPVQQAPAQSAPATPEQSAPAKP